MPLQFETYERAPPAAGIHDYKEFIDKTLELIEQARALPEANRNKFLQDAKANFDALALKAKSVAPNVLAQGYKDLPLSPVQIADLDAIMARFGNWDDLVSSGIYDQEVFVNEKIAEEKRKQSGAPAPPAPAGAGAPRPPLGETTLRSPPSNAATERSANVDIRKEAAEKRQRLVPQPAEKRGYMDSVFSRIAEEVGRAGSRDTNAMLRLLAGATVAAVLAASYGGGGEEGAAALPGFLPPAMARVPETIVTPDLKRMIDFLVRYYGAFKVAYYPPPEASMATILKNDPYLDGLERAKDWFTIRLPSFPEVVDVILLPKWRSFYVPLYLYGAALISSGRLLSSETEKAKIGIYPRMRAASDQMHAAELIGNAAVVAYKKGVYSRYIN